MTPELVLVLVTIAIAGIAVSGSWLAVLVWREFTGRADARSPQEHSGDTERGQAESAVCGLAGPQRDHQPDQVERRRDTDDPARVIDGYMPSGGEPGEPPTSNTAVVTTKPVTSNRVTRPRRLPNPREASGPSVEWRFKTDILDRLDVYFRALRRMRTFDKDAYRLFARTGFSIPASGYANWHHPEQLSTALQSQASFGGVLGPGCGECDPEFVQASVMYFQKLTQPGRVQLISGGEIYEFTIVWDDLKKFTAIGTCHIAKVGESFVLLREATHVQNTLRRRVGNRKESLTLSSVRWQYPPWIATCFQDARHPQVETLEQWVIGCFVSALATHYAANDHAVIRAKRDGITASFGIDLSRCPRFFNDRDKTEIAKDGKRKRIFHSVVKHERVNASKTVEVRAHYRGTRHFQWNGAVVTIVVPGVDLRTFSSPASRYEDIPELHRTNFIDRHAVGRRISALLDS